MRFRPFGQFWVMRDGSSGTSGTPGNEESVTCRFLDRRVGSNPTLTAADLSTYDSTIYMNMAERVLILATRLC